MSFRIGHGFDVHRFGEGDHLMIGGVRLPFDRGFVAHSDGDVLLHAISDALLGACALGDIGRHFPDTDPAWKGADSRALLRHANRHRPSLHSKPYALRSLLGLRREHSPNRRPAGASRDPRRIP